MATDEMNPPGPPDDGAPPPSEPEIVLSPEELDDLITGITAAFRRQRDAEQLLRRIGFPSERVPNFGTDPANAWNEVFLDFEHGVISRPYRRVLDAALRVYRNNNGLRTLAERHGLVSGATTPPVPVPTGRSATRDSHGAPSPGATAEPAPPAPTCHVIIRASSEAARQQAHGLLTELGLAPHEEWSTSHAVSFRIGSDSVPAVRQLLDHTDLGWTVVPPGEPDYLLQSLYVEGPDRRQFRVTDAPAQQTFRNLASEIITEQYPQGDANAALPTVIDHVQEGQTPRRVDADSTLHDAGVRDGDRVRVGYQTNAGSVNPLDREDALYRARNQIREYADSRSGFLVKANSSLLPTEYQLAFDRISFGPGPREGDEPVEIKDHLVALQLGPDFPREHPVLWWLTPIFHPNVFPNYDCEKARKNPGARGLVCLGLLGESWQPSWDFGDLCQMVVEMAAFRNYALVEDTGQVDKQGRPVLKGNAYDWTAVEWIVTHPKRITDIGGEIKFHTPQRSRSEYPNVIEPVE